MRSFRELTAYFRRGLASILGKRFPIEYYLLSAHMTFEGDLKAYEEE